MIYKAIDVLKTLSEDEVIRHKARIREETMINESILLGGERKKGREEGIKEGIRKGMEKGRKEQSENTARHLISLGKMTLEEISAATSLTVQELQELEKMKKNGAVTGRCLHVTANR